MFKLVVLSALLAVASAGVFHGAAYSVPTAVSHQSRTDVFSKPVVAYSAAPVVAAAYTAPVVKTVATAPVAYTSPLAYNTYAAYSAPVVKTVAAAPVAYTAAATIPTSVSYQSRTDVHSKPVVAAYSTPVVAAAYTAPIATAAYAAPVAYKYAASPVAYTGYGYADKLAYTHY
ncbi:PREDICTED: pupal cuticle protein C1B-like [Nicrophorus vespilloides]|uniref:Pupal cuticle protein C1B-like n=1 Tax=Nicrophorus vespilloides TaxID=110193 RepID=A0ABM1M056_NICVS|nr:PREDICTED: pupal cuticle protein C1B-like [Nicrophorus vespilloides]